jgi:hypothetical protein
MSFMVTLELLELVSGNNNVHPQLEIEIVQEAGVEMSSSLRFTSNQITQ